MKVCFFGLGSIGKRHLRLLKNLGNFEYFAFKRYKSEEKGVKSIYSWDEFDKAAPDVAFITNPTEYHIKTAWFCAHRSIPFFLEKPIGHNLNGMGTLLREVEKRDLVTYVAYPLRFHKTIVGLKDGTINPQNRKIICKTDSTRWPSQRRLNTVMLELSHEIDYASYIWGEIVEIGGTIGVKQTWADLMLTHADGNKTSVALDMANPIETRSVSGFPVSATDDVYTRQLQYFLGNLSNRRMMNNLVDASRLFEQIIDFQEENESSNYNLR